MMKEDIKIDGHVVENGIKNSNLFKSYSSLKMRCTYFTLRVLSLDFLLFLTHNAAFCDVIKDLNFLNEF